MPQSRQEARQVGLLSRRERRERAARNARIGMLVDYHLHRAILVRVEASPRELIADVCASLSPVCRVRPQVVRARIARQVAEGRLGQSPDGSMVRDQAGCGNPLAELRWQRILAERQECADQAGADGVPPMGPLEAASPVIDRPPAWWTYPDGGALDDPRPSNYTQEQTVPGLLAGLDDHVLGVCVRWLPVHPRPFDTTARASKRLQRAVEAVREELGEQVCEEHGLESARGRMAERRLIKLVEDGDTAGAVRLMVAGAPLDGADWDGFTALMWAAYQGRTEIALALIRAGAALDLQNRYRWTALIQAAEKGHTEIALALIHAGAALDLQRRDGCTALIDATHKGHTEIALALIRAGAASDLKNDCGWGALEFATAYKRAEIAAALTEADSSLH